MVVFNQLRVSSDGTTIYIDVHVNNASYFNNVYLESITVATSDAILESYSSSGTVPESVATNYIYHLDFDSNLKETSLALNQASFDEAFAGTGDSTATTAFTGNIGSTLFFVYIKCMYDGEPDECTPCDLSNTTTVATTFNTKLVHQKVMGYTKQLANDCTIPQDFINFILSWEAFKSSIETGHYIPAINFFNKMFNSTGINAVTNKTCRCHG